jgi:large subunit ribosomal protein L4
MITLNVYNRQGDSVGTVQVDPAEFGGEVNKQLLHEVVLMYLANQRAGTHSTLRAAGGRQYRSCSGRRAPATPASALGGRTTQGGGRPRAPNRATTSTICPGRPSAPPRMAVLSKLQDNEAVILDDTLNLPEIKTKTVAELLES